jgi:hypothetical protein
MTSMMSKSSTGKIGVYKDSFFGPSIINGTTFDVAKTMAAGTSGHYGYPDFPPERDVGGDFVLYGREHQRANISVSCVGSGAWRNDSYSGFISCSTSAGAPDVGTWSPAAWGAEAFSKMKPTKPVGNISNSIYELKDIPSMLLDLKGTISNFKDLGDTYLQHQFGWLPTLRDALGLLKLQMDTQKKLEQLLRDNGKLVRRRIVLFDNVSNEVNTSGEAWGLMNPGFVSYFYSGTPRYTSRAFTTDSVWGSAAFRYWLPSGPKGIVYKPALIRALHGSTNLGPTALYNMIPWSWLVDWFSNVGYVIDNLDAGVADRLAADWFYMMRKKVNVIQTEITIPLIGPDRQPIVVSGTATQQSYSKVRLRGSPFGFAINESSLNPMQLSILGALGLSKL